MKNLLNPKWLLLINSLPILAVLFIFWGEYQVLQSILSPENKTNWHFFGAALALLGIANLVYTLVAINQKLEVSAAYAFSSLLIYSSYLYSYSFYYDDIIPFTVPRWMLQDSPILYLGTFVMPTLAYALLVVVVQSAKKVRENTQVWNNILYAFLIPLAWYLFFQILMPFWTIGSHSGQHIIVIGFIISAISFLFFIAKFIYITISNKEPLQKESRFWLKLLISIPFPLLGLALNMELYDAFGDFSGPWFFVLAIVNGFFICLPDLDHKNYRYWLFLARSSSFSYTLYFFLVFIPYLPLSVLAILAIGAGILMLTPLMLFILHAQQLYSDFEYLKQQGSSSFMRRAPLLSFLLIPILITTTFLNDKLVLKEALAYLYEPNYSQSERINKNALNRTLKAIKSHKEKGSFLFGTQTPFLSSYYNWLVLDNLTISGSKIALMEQIFEDKPNPNVQSRFIEAPSPDSVVGISSININSRFDHKKQTWVSQVDFEFKNHSINSFQEYLSYFKLPTGCFISDYYLFVGDRKEQGILAEKKSAMWIYSEIRNTNRDPGMLKYEGNNRISFRVFPFSSGELRRTGIEFIHKEPVSIQIDTHNIALGHDSLQQQLPAISESSDANVIYIPAAIKASLPKVQRKPYYHFLVDLSKETTSKRKAYINSIENLLSKNDIAPSDCKISFVNSYVKTIQMNGDWKTALKKQPCEGGFYLERAIKILLFELSNKTTLAYPQIVVLSDKPENAVLEGDFSDFEAALPETNHFYFLNNLGQLDIYSLYHKPYIKLSEQPDNEPRSVLAYPNAENPIAYLANDGAASIALKKDKLELKDADISEKSWESALTLQGYWTSSQVLHPESSGKTWLDLVRYSFKSKVMMPTTAYIALENEAQKAVLKRKQEQVLRSNKSLDLQSDTQAMSEPSLWALAALFGGILGWQYFAKRKKMAS